VWQLYIVLFTLCTSPWTVNCQYRLGRWIKGSRWTGEGLLMGVVVDIILTHSYAIVEHARNRDSLVTEDVVLHAN